MPNGRYGLKNGYTCKNGIPDNRDTDIELEQIHGLVTHNISSHRAKLSTENGVR